MMYQTMINVYISVNDLIPFTVDFNSLISTTENGKLFLIPIFYVFDSKHFSSFVYLLALHVCTLILPLYELKYRLSCFVLYSSFLPSSINNNRFSSSRKEWKEKKKIQIWRETKKNYLLYLKLNIKRQMIKICWKSEDFFWWNLRTETSLIGVCLRIEKLIRTETIYEMKLDSACLHSTASVQ